MKRHNVRTCVIAALLAAFAFAPAARAEYKCANPNGSIEVRTCAMAAAGPDTLRRFIARTQGIYILYYWDYVPTQN